MIVAAGSAGAALAMGAGRGLAQRQIPWAATQASAANATSVAATAPARHANGVAGRIALTGTPGRLRGGRYNRRSPLRSASA